MKRFVVLFVVSLLISSTLTFADTSISKSEFAPYSIGNELQWPTVSTRVTDDYSYRNCPNHGWEHHSGIDIGAVNGGVAGDPIYSADYGTVVYSGFSKEYGNVTLINSYYSEQNFRLQTRYAHQESISTASGSNVSSGSTIGKMGETGPADGVHLHYETRQIDSSTTVWSGVTKDPLIVHSSGTVTLLAKQNNFDSLNIEPDENSIIVGTNIDGFGFLKGDKFFTVDYICNAELSNLKSHGLNRNDIDNLLKESDSKINASQRGYLVSLANKLN